MMLSEIENQILHFYDRCPTRDQIRKVAKMYKIGEARVMRILELNGREIPPGKRGPKPKAKGLEADLVIIDEAAAPSNSNEQVKSEISNSNPQITKMPDCVAKTIEKRMHELEADIKNYQEAIDNYRDMVSRLESEYTAHANYLLTCPFEQRDLSHSSSDNMIESPQPTG